MHWKKLSLLWAEWNMNLPFLLELLILQEQDKDTKSSVGTPQDSLELLCVLLSAKVTLDHSRGEWEVLLCHPRS